MSTTSDIWYSSVYVCIDISWVSYSVLVVDILFGTWYIAVLLLPNANSILIIYNNSCVLILNIARLQCISYILYIFNDKAELILHTFML